MVHSPKNDILKEAIRSAILSGEFKPGDKLPSQSDLCLKYQAGLHTVREVIASLAQEGLVSRISGKGTFITQNRKTPVNIGVVMPQMHCHNSVVITGQLLECIESAASDNGYHIIVCFDSDDVDAERKNLESLIQRNVDAIICYYVGAAKNYDVLKSICDANIPLVLIDRHPEPFPLSVDTVTCDNLEGARQGIRCLIEMGYTSIHHITHESLISTVTDRIDGYSLAMSEAGLGESIHRLKLHEMAVVDDIKSQAKAIARNILISRHGPQAFFTANLVLLEGVVDALAEFDIPAEEVALCSFESMEEIVKGNHLMVNIIQPLNHIGSRSVEMVAERISGRTATYHVAIPPRIVVTDRRMNRPLGVSSSSGIHPEAAGKRSTNMPRQIMFLAPE